MTKWLRLGVVLALVRLRRLGGGLEAAASRKGYVSDFAGVVDPASRSRLEAYCAGVEQATGAQMALVTIPSLEGEPIEDVANTIFRAWGVGQKGKNEGIMLLLAIGDRRSRLEVGYGLEPILPDGLAGRHPARNAARPPPAAISATPLIGRRPDHRQRHRAGQARAAIGHRCRGACAALFGDSIPWPMLIGRRLFCCCGCCAPAGRAAMADSAAADCCPG